MIISVLSPQKVLLLVYFPLSKMGCSQLVAIPETCIDRHKVNVVKEKCANWCYVVSFYSRHKKYRVLVVSR